MNAILTIGSLLLLVAVFFLIRIWMHREDKAPPDRDQFMVIMRDGNGKYRLRLKGQTIQRGVWEDIGDSLRRSQVKAMGPYKTVEAAEVAAKEFMANEEFYRRSKILEEVKRV